MKKILLLICSFSVSIHAMEQSPEITPYNKDMDEKPLSEIFFEAFPDAQEIPEEMSDPSANTNASIAVLKYDSKPVGFAMWECENVCFNKAFSDIADYQNRNEQLNVLRLNYLAINKNFRTTKDRQGKGFGKALLAYIKKIALTTDQDIIALNAETGSASFYEKHEYQKTSDDSKIDLMALPLNDDVKDILKAVKAARIKNKQNGKGLRLNRFLI